MNSMIQAVLQATAVSKGVLLLLLFMSIASWAYMCGKWLTLRRAQSQTRQGLADFDDAGELSTALPASKQNEQLIAALRSLVRHHREPKD